MRIEIREGIFGVFLFSDFKNIYERENNKLKI